MLSHPEVISVSQWLLRLSSILSTCAFIKACDFGTVQIASSGEALWPHMHTHAHNTLSSHSVSHTHAHTVTPATESLGK